MLLPGEAAGGGLAAATVPQAVPYASAAAAAAAAAAGPAEGEALSLVRDWSAAPLDASSSSSAGSGRQGAAWRPGTSVHSFECGSGGAAFAAASATAYVQDGGGDGAGDKRRRLTPGMLAHCLRPAISAAVAEAAAMDAAGPCSRPAPTPGRTPKRKHRQVSGASLAAAAAAAPDAATPSPAASPATAGVQHTAPVQLFGRFDCAQAGLQQAQQQGGCRALAAPPAVVECQRFQTFDLFDAKWHGGGQAQALALVPANSRAGRRRHASGCSMM